MVVTGSWDCSVRFWDCRQPTEAFRLPFTHKVQNEKGHRPNKKVDPKLCRMLGASDQRDGRPLSDDGGELGGTIPGRSAAHSFIRPDTGTRPTATRMFTRSVA